MGRAYSIASADKSAEMTADTLASDQFRPPGIRIKADRLMPAVHTGYIASAASVALIDIEHREQNSVTLYTLVVYNSTARASDQLIQR